MPNEIVSSLKVKIYSDGADKASLLELAKSPFVSGFTTNPTLMRKAGINDYRAFAKDILASIKDRPISFEVFADDFPNMARQAREIASWGANVYVKIPVTNSKGEPATALVHELAHAKIKLNVTAVFTLEQVHAICQALKGGAPSVVSVFAGRIADTGCDPMPFMQHAVNACNRAGGMEVIWASPRELLNIFQADEIGCHVITVTPDIIKKLGGAGKDLGLFSLETVKLFYNDGAAAGFKL